MRADSSASAAPHNLPPSRESCRVRIGGSKSHLQSQLRSHKTRLLNHDRSILRIQLR